MTQLSDAELTNKINKFLTKKMPDYTPASSHFPEKEADAKLSVFAKLSNQYTTLIGNQPVLHR